MTTLKTASRETIKELTPEMSASQAPYGRQSVVGDLSKLHRALLRRGGVLLISSHGDDRRIFLGLKSSIL